MASNSDSFANRWLIDRADSQAVVYFSAAVDETVSCLASMGRKVFWISYGRPASLPELTDSSSGTITVLRSIAELGLQADGNAPTIVLNEFEKAHPASDQLLRDIRQALQGRTCKILISHARQTDSKRKDKGSFDSRYIADLVLPYLSIEEFTIQEDVMLLWGMLGKHDSYSSAANWQSLPREKQASILAEETANLLRHPLKSESMAVDGKGKVVEGTPREQEEPSEQPPGESHQEVLRLQQKIQNLTLQRDQLRNELSVLRSSSAYQAGLHFRDASKSLVKLISLPFNLLKLQRKSNKNVEQAKEELRLPVPKYKLDSSKLNIAVILDEFSFKSFGPEANLIRFKPDNWRLVFEEYKIDLLFVESAWHGNDDSWQYRIASYQKKFGDELGDVVDYCSVNNIPTVFWNKEDPVHFDRFIDSAKKFSIVCTTDEQCIKKYKRELNHDGVVALPFAAQPVINNPLVESPRKMAACFAGSYYASRHDQRRKDMEKILEPAIDFNLEIWDRNHGASHRSAEQFAWPEKFRPHIKGRLEYREMLEAYKQYRVFLNVNSVTESRTMFSRRVFELLACGTPVISTHSAGIVEQLGEDAVLLTDSQKQTREHLEKLFTDEKFWWQKSLTGMRKVFESHTYKHRLATIIANTDYKVSKTGMTSTCMVVRLKSISDADRLIAMVRGQTQLPDVVIPVLPRFEAEQIADHLNNGLSGIKLKIIQDEEEPVGYIRDAINGFHCDLVFFVNPAFAYNSNYIRDSSMVPLFLKHALVVHPSRSEFNNGQLKQLNGGLEYQRVKKAPAHGMAVTRKSINNERIRIGLNGEEINQSKWPLVSLHPYCLITSPDGSDVPLDEGTLNYLKV